MGCYTNSAGTICNETTENSPCSPCDTECPMGIWKTGCITYTGTTQTCTGLTITNGDSMNELITTLVTKICDLETRLAALE